jgi:hypothetical protein
MELITKNETVDVNKIFREFPIECKQNIEVAIVLFFLKSIGYFFPQAAISTMGGKSRKKHKQKRKKTFRRKKNIMTGGSLFMQNIYIVLLLISTMIVANGYQVWTDEQTVQNLEYIQDRTVNEVYNNTKFTKGRMGVCTAIAMSIVGRLNDQGYGERYKSLVENYHGLNKSEIQKAMMGHVTIKFSSMWHEVKNEDENNYELFLNNLRTVLINMRGNQTGNLITLSSSDLRGGKHAYNIMLTSDNEIIIIDPSIFYSKEPKYRNRFALFKETKKYPPFLSLLPENNELKSSFLSAPIQTYLDSMDPKGSTYFFANANFIKDDRSNDNKESLKNLTNEIYKTDNKILSFHLDRLSADEKLKDLIEDKRIRLVNKYEKLNDQFLSKDDIERSTKLQKQQQKKIKELYNIENYFNKNLPDNDIKNPNFTNNYPQFMQDIKERISNIDENFEV